MRRTPHKACVTLRPIDSHRLRFARCADRRGAVVVVAMITLLLVSMIGVSLVRLALAQQKQVQREQLRLQAEWLTEAGLNRGAARLAADPEYMGEDWQIEAQALKSRRGGSVRIAVEPAEPQSAEGTLRVIATFPADSNHRAQVSRALRIRLHRGE